MHEDDLEQQARACNGGYLHGEAFCLMTYATRDGSEVEYIWNSRDGVTPFTVRSRSGAEMRHVDWLNDRRVPNYEPQIGERIFVDLTPMRARILATEVVDRYWDQIPSEDRQGVGSKEDLIDLIVVEDLRRLGEPDLIEVGP
jgi:hypothetical protein